MKVSDTLSGIGGIHCTAVAFPLMIAALKLSFLPTHHTHTDSSRVFTNVSHTMCPVKNFTSQEEGKGVLPLFYIDAFTSSRETIHFTIEVDPIENFELRCIIVIGCTVRGMGIIVHVICGRGGRGEALPLANIIYALPLLYPSTKINISGEQAFHEKVTCVLPSPISQQFDC